MSDTDSLHATEESEGALLARARAGDRAAFDALVARALPKLRGVIRRLVGHCEDTDDLVQDSLLRAYERLATYRGESAFSTWLVSIGSNAALNHLRRQQRWRFDAQVRIGKHLHNTEDGKRALKAIFSSPEHRFDAREHISFCFTCVGRSLDSEGHAVLLLRDVMGYKNREAAKILGLSESVLRRRLSEARATMQERFDDLCGLVSKRGICYQCEGLRGTTSAERRGPPIPDLQAPCAPEPGEPEPPPEPLRMRLRVIREPDVDAGATQMLHDFVWRAIERYERART